MTPMCIWACKQALHKSHIFPIMSHACVFMHQIWPPQLMPNYAAAVNSLVNTGMKVFASSWIASCWLSMGSWLWDLLEPKAKDIWPILCGNKKSITKGYKGPLIFSLLLLQKSVELLKNLLWSRNVGSFWCYLQSDVSLNVACGGGKNSIRK